MRSFVGNAQLPRAQPGVCPGIFLYVAYREMRRLEADILERIDERRSSKDIAAQRSLAYVTPDHFYGIDVNGFTVEVAKVTMTLAKKNERRGT